MELEYGKTMCLTLHAPYVKPCPDEREPYA